MLKPIGDFKIGWEKSYFKLDSFHGEVTEWLNVAVSKTVVRESVPRVRIPLSPPLKNMVLFSYISGLQIGVNSTDNTLLNRLKDKILSKGI